MSIFEGELDPTQDGITHLNVYSKAKTRLGRFLSNFAHTPFECEDGKFASIEGYWYWLKTGNPMLQTMHGWEAKKFGKICTPRKSPIPWDEFQTRIKRAIDRKMDAFHGAVLELRKTDLPLAHYYVFGGVAKDAGHKWILEHIDSYRR